MAVSRKKASKQFSKSTHSLTSGEDLQVYCQPCDEEGIRLPAHGYCTNCKEHLCKTCFTVHEKQKVSKHHTLLNGINMPKALQQPSTSIHTGQPEDMTLPCLIHPKEMIKFYCHDHEELLCNVCVTLEHQATSCQVNYIPDISGDIIDSKEYQIILKSVNTNADCYQNVAEDIKKMVNKSNSSLHQALADIRKFRQEINKRLDELEKKAENAAKFIEQENNKHLKAVETTCKDLTKSLKISSDKIKRLNMSKQPDKLFIELKLTKKTLKDIEETATTIQQTSHDIKEHNFKENEGILKYLTKEEYFGTLIQKTLQIESQSVQIKSRQFSHLGEICVKTSKHDSRCYITGMTLLTPEHLIITDYNKNAVKMVDTRSKSVSDQLELDDGPWDITTVTSTELAVTHPNIHTIQFISISSNKLLKKHSIKMDGECRGISCYHGKLVISYCVPAKLQIVDMNGTILTTIDGKNIFKFPWYITSNRSSIYVSDFDMNTVTRFNWQGDIIGSFSGMSDPAGISLSDDGTIFVCDWERNVIEEISGDFSTGKVVLKDLTTPQTVCWCEKTKMLYHSCNIIEEKYDNFIQIYKLS